MSDGPPTEDVRIARAVCEELVAVERAVDVGAITYRGLHLWPMIRSMVSALVRSQPDGGRMTAPRDRWTGFAQTVMAQAGTASRDAVRALRDRCLEQHDGLLNRLDIGDPVDFLFHPRGLEHFQTLHGQPFAPTLDSLALLAKRDHSVVKLESGAPEARFVPSRFVHSVPLQTALLAEEWLEHGAERREPDSVIAGIAPLLEYLRRRFPGRVDAGPLFTDAAWNIWLHARLADGFLDRIKPNAVFLSCFFDPRNQGLIAAARTRGIVTVDVQHGMQSPFHTMYTHYARVPATGYGTMPDVFWNWGKVFSDWVTAWAPLGTEVHRTLVGGHPLMALFNDGFPPAIEPEDAAFLDELTRSGPRILVSLQSSIDDTPLPELLAQAMTQAPADWVWLVRRHPLMRWTAREIEEALRTLGVPRWNVRSASGLPLPVLLPRADHHITQYSSTAVEAHAYGVATTALSPVAGLYMADLVANGVCAIAVTADGVVADVARRLDGRDGRSLPPPAIEAKPETARAAFRGLAFRREGGRNSPQTL